MGDGPYAHTRHHALRRLAAEAQLRANSVVTPAASGGRPPRMAAVLQDQGPLQQLLSSSFGVPASTAEQAASRSQRGLSGSRGQRDDGGAPTPTSRGAPLSRLLHGSGAGRLHGGSPANCAAGLNDAGSAGRVGPDLSCAQPPSRAYARDDDGRGLPACATSSPLGRAEARAVDVSNLGARGASLTTGRPSSAADAARRESVAEQCAAVEQSISEATAELLGQLGSRLPAARGERAAYSPYVPPPTQPAALPEIEASSRARFLELQQAEIRAEESARLHSDALRAAAAAGPRAPRMRSAAVESARACGTRVGALSHHGRGKMWKGAEWRGRM